MTDLVNSAVNDARTPPHDADAEASVLGAMMLDANVIDDVADLLTGKDFYRPANETIFDAVTALHARAEPCDAVTVASELERRGDLGRVGGTPYLHTLVATPPSAAAASYYADLVREKALQRGLVEASTQIGQLGYSGEGRGDELYDRAEQALAAKRRGGGLDTSIGMDQAIREAIDELEHGVEPGIPTGHLDIDGGLNPMKPGQLLIVGARPGGGKSLMLLDIARHVALKQGLPVLMLSLEMQRKEFAKRALAAEGVVPLQHLEQNELTEDDWVRISRVLGHEHWSKLRIEDFPSVDLPAIRAKVRSAIRHHGARLVLIDYLQLIVAPRAASRREAVDEVSRSLKILAGVAQVPIVVAAQLNRASESRIDKVPTLADLRESGSIENDADAVLLIHRPDLHDRESDRPGEVDVIVAKQRSGPTFTATLAFQGHYGRIVDMGGHP